MILVDSDDLGDSNDFRYREIAITLQIVMILDIVVIILEDSDDFGNSNDFG